MRRCCARIIGMLFLLSVTLGMLTASAEEPLIFAAAREAVDVGEWVELSTWLASGSATGWKSADPSILLVEEDGTATGQKRGETVVTAYGAGEQEITCTVTVGYYTGMDVSYAQLVDWDTVLKQGIDFAMLRSSYGWDDRSAGSTLPYDFQMDAQFTYNAAGAKRVGIPYGLYHYSYAVTVKEAEMEADYLLGLLKQTGVTPADVKLPIAYDVEENSTSYPNLDTLRKMGKDAATEVVLTFCRKLQAAGYRTALYTSKSHFDLFDTAKLTREGVRLWMAWYAAPADLDLTAPPALGGPTPFMWQYTDKGLIEGVTRRSASTDAQNTVDLNVMYMSDMMLHRPAEKPVPVPDPTGPGDVDGNGAITAADALITLQYSTQKITLTEPQITAADVDGQAGVTAADALMILQVSTQKISGFQQPTV